MKISKTVWERRAGIGYIKYALKTDGESISYRVKPYCCVTALLENSEEMVFMINDYYTQDEYLSDKNEISLWKENNDEWLRERIAALLQTVDLKYERLDMSTLLLVDYENCEIIPDCVFYTLSGDHLEMIKAEHGQEILENGKQHQYSADEL